MNQLKISSLISIVLFSLSTHAFAADAAVKSSAQAADAAKPIVATKPEGMPADIVAKPTPAKTLEEIKIETPKVDTSTLYGKTDRPLGDFMVGPYVTLISLPRPISFGAEVKWKDLVGVSGSYGFFPKLTISDVSMKITGSDFRFKIYPFQGAFYIGVGFGSQTFTGTKVETISGQSVTGNVSMDTKYIAPQIGWNWVWSSGFFMGMDLGVQLASSHTSAFSSDAPAAVTATAQYQKLQKDILDLADTFGKTPIPLLTLVKIGYFF